MKKTSIVLCIFCLLLIVSGIILCFVAKGSGDVFDNTALTEGANQKRTPIDESKIKLIVDYTKVTIHVYGNAQESYIDTINIDDDQIKIKNNEITITDKSDYLTMAYDTVTKFDGLRNILFPGKSYTGEKTINIYLKDDQKLTQLNLKTEGGEVTLQALNANTDYNIRVDGMGDITLKDIATESSISLHTDTGNVTLDEVTFMTLNGSIGVGNFCYTTPTPKGQICDLKCTANGTVYVYDEENPDSENGTSRGSEYKLEADEAEQTGDSLPGLTFSVENGNIYLLKKAGV